jgi:NAD(P)H-hydrate epimerase
VIGLAGSEGMTGAAILMGKAVIQLGAGLCTIYSDESSRTILQNSLPEALFGNYNNIALDIKYTYAIGPGLGKKNEVKTLLNRILDHTTRPVVIDADGLNIIAEDKTILAKLPPESILTPHPKEFENLFGTTVDTFARLKLQKESAQKYNCVIVLKDHHTTICTPQGEVYYNNTGNPGMAKGGSGDVLTGMIASLLAQGISSKKSAIAAVYLHGLAADIYCRQNHMATLTPTDIISQLSNALKETLSV